MLFLLLPACLRPLDDSPTGVFDYVWSDFDALYGGFHQRGVDWDEVHDTFAPRVRDEMSDDALYEVLGEMIATLDDGHVRMVAPGREMAESNHVYRDDTMEGTFDIEVVKRNYLHGPIDTGKWDWYVYGRVADGVPYLWLPGVDDNTYVIDTIADEYPHAKALIVDLRHNGGGAFTYALHGMGRLTEQDIPVWRERTRNGPGRDQYDDWMTWDLPARTPHWGAPLIVLVDALTVSAGERMLMALVELPQTTTIGVPSNGSIATSVGRQAPNGWNYMFSVQEVEAVDGAVYEAVGVPVDIELLNDPAAVEAGIDTVLEAAIALAQRG